ncbi:MAG: cysteine hydrolase [Acidimicrobiales bacterium]
MVEPQARPLVLPATGRTAVVTMEMQRGVVGDLAVLPDLAAEVARRGTAVATARLVSGARAHGVRVVHCTVEYPADGAGGPTNAPLLAALARGPQHLLAGAPAVELVPGLGPEPEDLIEARSHGVSPFGGTSLAATLGSLGIETLVVAGVSVNLGVFGLAVEAVNLGYRVVIPVDAVAGLPTEYAADVLRHSLSLVARLTTVDAVLTAWAS